MRVGTVFSWLRRAKPALLALALGLVMQVWADFSMAASGCCSRHKGVCGCTCCDDTPLSDICRAKMPQCDGDAAATDSPPKKKQNKKHKKKPRKTSKSGLVTDMVFAGVVNRVSDGDTIVVSFKNKPHRIRLADIDCPELAQPFGLEAEAFVENLTNGKTVTVKVRAIDRYKRAVADVTLADGRSLNGLLLQAGLAWWYKHYSRDKALEAIEKTARDAHKGLWRQKDPLPPWTFRRNQRNAR